MSRVCTICSHPQLREITHELLARHPLRWIAARHANISIFALSRHVRRHVTKALRKVAPGDVTTTMAAELSEQVVVTTRKLNARTERILDTAEENKDYTVALQAIREYRRNLELIAKLTGELHPLAPGEAAAGGGLHVTVVYADKAAVQVGSSETPLGASAAHLEANGDGGSPCPR